MGFLAIALLLVAYNNLLNMWPPFNGWLYVPANLALTASLVGVGVWGFGLDDSEILGTWPIGPGIVAGIGLGVVLTAPLFVMLWSPRSARRIADRRVAGLGGMEAAYQMLVRIPIGTALLEEVAFRGILFAALSHLGDLRAAIWSSVLFGLWHIGPTLNLMRANRPQATMAAKIAGVAIAVVGTTAAGLVFVGLRLWAGTLWAPWALHATLNSLATLAAVLAHGWSSEASTQRQDPNMTEGAGPPGE